MYLLFAYKKYAFSTLSVCIAIFTEAYNTYPQLITTIN